MFHKSVVFFGSAFGERMKPVRVVGGSHLKRPFLHSRRHFISNTAVQRRTVVNYINQFGIYLARQIPEHLFLVEYILGEVFRRTFRRDCHCNGFLLERRLYYSESQF